MPTYTKVDTRIPVFKGATTHNAPKVRPQTAREMRPMGGYSPNHSLNQSKPHGTYSGTQGYHGANHNSSLVRSNLDARSQEREFAIHRQHATAMKNGRIGDMVRDHKYGETANRGPQGEDRFHRDSNSHSHNGAYRDHRWDTHWGNADNGKRQQLNDDTWRQTKRAEQVQLSKDKSRGTEDQLAREFSHHQRNHPMANQPNSPYQSNAQSDFERRRYEKKYAKAYGLEFDSTLGIAIRPSE